MHSSQSLLSLNLIVAIKVRVLNIGYHGKASRVRSQAEKNMSTKLIDAESSFVFISPPFCVSLSKLNRAAQSSMVITCPHRAMKMPVEAAQKVDKTAFLH